MEYDLIENDGVFTLKNQNTTIGFVRFNELGEVEYIFVNPLFRRRNFASKLLELVRKKTGKRIIFQPPISPLGENYLVQLKILISHI